MVFMDTSEVSSTARTREANARSPSEVCLEYSHGLPSLPGTLTAEVLKQFSEELVRSVRKGEKIYRQIWVGGVEKRVPDALLRCGDTAAFYYDVAVWLLGVAGVLLIRYVGRSC